MIGIILLVFTTIFVVEIGDKTQIAMLIMASKTKKHFLLFLGIMAGFLVGGGIAVFIGATLTKIVPLYIIKYISIFLFITFGIMTLRNGRKEEKIETQELQKAHFYRSNPFFSAFTLVFFAEIGDKSQIALALFSTKHNPFFVYIVGMIALMCITILTVYLGKIISRKIHERIISQFAGWLFIIIGIAFYFLPG